MAETILTTKIRGNIEVLAKEYEGIVMTVCYANRTQAQKKATRLGAGWTVFQSPLSRRFFVRRLPTEETTNANQ